MSHESINVAMTAQTNDHRPEHMPYSHRTNGDSELSGTPVAKSHPQHRVMTGLQFLIAAILLIVPGCQESEEDREKARAARAEEQLAEVMARFPVPTPDTPEQTQQKINTCQQLLPQAEAALEASGKAATDTEKLSELDKAIDISLEAVRQVAITRQQPLKEMTKPAYRAATKMVMQTRLTRFLALETVDPHQSDVDIRTACLYSGRLTKNFDDLSENELLLCQECYFNRARMESNAWYNYEEFVIALKNLTLAGFADADRLKTEPKFEFFRTDPNTAAALESAIASAEAAAKEALEEETKEEDPPTEEIPENDSSVSEDPGPAE
ncbi:MAG: hypothetical protein MK102_10070 [Fuerstiella sp.]|nr:hypothetical protein [Fuerstiella sp.]